MKTVIDLYRPIPSMRAFAVTNAPFARPALRTFYTMFALTAAADLFAADRPSRNWKGDNFLGKDPASTTIRHKAVDVVAHAEFSAPIRGIAPEKR